MRSGNIDGPRPHINNVCIDNLGQFALLLIRPWKWCRTRGLVSQAHFGGFRDVPYTKIMSISLQRIAEGQEDGQLNVFGLGRFPLGNRTLRNATEVAKF